jgi:hypothetical protein
MSKKSRLSRNQKRQQKLAKRDRRQSADGSLAYTGNRYKKEEFVEPLYETEMGIYEAFVVSGRELTDDDAEEELEELIGALRERPAAELIFTRSEEADFERGWVATAVFPHWQRMLEERTLPARDDLIGILRTILGSLDTWRSKSASSRAYLNYLEGFMNKMGVRVYVETKEGEPLPEPPVDELAEVGEMWLAGSPEAQQRFTTLANELLQKGQSQRVVDACHKLLGSIGTPTRPEFPILSELSIRAQNAQKTLAAPEFAPGIKRFLDRLTGW